MELLLLLLRGMVIGLAIAAPVGPIGLLCFQRTLNRGWAHGLASGLGAATADGLYGLAAALGLSIILAGRSEGGDWLQIAGGLFLCWLGLSAMSCRTATPATAPAGSLTRDYATTFLLTLANPATIFAFLAIFAGAGAIDATSGHALTLVLGVCLGSALWWIGLATAATALKRRLSRRHIVSLNQLSGSAILGFGLWMIGSLLLS